MSSKKVWLSVAAFLVIVAGGIAYSVHEGFITLPRFAREAMTTTPAGQSMATGQTAASRSHSAPGKFILPVVYPGNPKPDYPEYSMMRHEEGRVLLNVHIGRDGRVTDAKVLRSSGYSRLDRAALTTVSKDWRYIPARQDRKAVPTWHKVRITFTCRSAGHDICEESF